MPPDYTGPVPEGGFYVAHSRTMRYVLRPVVPRDQNDPKARVETIKETAKIYPYEAGGVGTRVAEFLAGKTMLGKVSPPPATVFHEGSGKVINTVPPNDFGAFFEMINEVVQQRASDRRSIPN